MAPLYASLDPKFGLKGVRARTYQERYLEWEEETRTGTDASGYAVHKADKLAEAQIRTVWAWITELASADGRLDAESKEMVAKKMPDDLCRLLNNVNLTDAGEYARFVAYCTGNKEGTVGLWREQKRIERNRLPLKRADGRPWAGAGAGTPGCLENLC